MRMELQPTAQLCQSGASSLLRSMSSSSALPGTTSLPLTDPAITSTDRTAAA